MHGCKYTHTLSHSLTHTHTHTHAYTHTHTLSLLLTFLHTHTDTLSYTHTHTCTQMHVHRHRRVSVIVYHTGVALTFEKLRIANAQHRKNCVSSPAAKTTISTDLPKICPGHDRAGLQTAHRPFWLRHQQYVGTSIPSLGMDGEGRGEGAVEI